MTELLEVVKETYSNYGKRMILLVSSCPPKYAQNLHGSTEKVIAWEEIEDFAHFKFNLDECLRRKVILVNNVNPEELSEKDSKRKGTCI